MPWLLMIIGLALGGLLIAALRLGSASMPRSSRRSAIVMVAVGLVMIGFGVISMIIGWVDEAYAMPIVGIVFLAVGMRDLRRAAGS